MTYSLPQSWLDAMLEAVCLVDEASLHILAANHAVAELVGKPVHELVNTPVQGLAATPQDFVFWSQPVQALAEGIHSETSVLHASGALVPVERSVRGVTLPNGGGALLLTMIDLTAQRTTERELETLLSELRANPGLSSRWHAGVRHGWQHSSFQPEVGQHLAHPCGAAHAT